MTNFYGGGPLNKYGSGAFYGATNVVTIPVTPIDLQFYRTSQDGVYTFYWTFQPADFTTTLESFDYQLELDTDPSFTSPNFVSFTSSEVITFQDGNVWKGYTVPVAARIDGVIQTWYARVRVVSGINIGNWSDVLIWTIPQKWQLQEADALMEFLPDYHVYGKGDLLKPVNQRNTNLWVVENMYANQLDKVYYELFLTKTDNFIALCRDEFLYQNFGILFNYPKPNLQTFIEYRETLKQLIIGSLNGSTLEPVLGVIQTFTGVFPLIENIRDRNDFFLNLIQQGTPNSNVGSPYTEPGNGVRTQFHVQYMFLPGTMTLFKNGTLLTPGIDFTEDEALPGFMTTTPPLSTDVLVVFYQIGKPADLRPILFDIPLNLLQNGGFESWSNGVNFINPPFGSATADNWDIYYFGGGPTFTISQNSTIVDSGNFSLELNLIALGGITQIQLQNFLPNFQQYIGHTLTINIRVNTTLPNVSAFLYWGTGNSTPAVHPGDGNWHTLTSTGTISSTANTIAVVVANSPATAGTFYVDTGVVLDNSLATFINGNITYTNGSFDVTGTGTSFTTQLVSGNTLVDANGYYATVFDVESPTTLKLVDAWGGPTETVYAIKATTNIMPPVLWDKGTLAFGVIITVLNPADFDIDLALIESLVNPLLPAQVKVFYELAI